MITEKEGQILVRLARQVIAEHLNVAVGTPLDMNVLAAPAFQARRGVFVTLHKEGSLRGCIGSLAATETILEEVRRQALNAAFHDHRFAPVAAQEVQQLKISVSILTEPQPLGFSDCAELIKLLRPNVDGVILRARFGAGATFLPQVWEQLPSPELFLSHLCRKAGLPDNAWRTEPIEIQTYQVQYFEESR